MNITSEAADGNFNDRERAYGRIIQVFYPISGHYILRPNTTGATFHMPASGA